MRVCATPPPAAFLVCLARAAAAINSLAVITESSLRKSAGRSRVREDRAHVETKSDPRSLTRPFNICHEVYNDDYFNYHNPPGEAAARRRDEVIFTHVGRR